MIFSAMNKFQSVSLPRGPAHNNQQQGSLHHYRMASQARQQNCFHGEGFQVCRQPHIGSCINATECRISRQKAGTQKRHKEGRSPPGVSATQQACKGGRQQILCASGAAPTIEGLTSRKKGRFKGWAICHHTAPYHCMTVHNKGRRTRTEVKGRHVKGRVVNTLHRHRIMEICVITTRSIAPEEKN